MASGQPASPVYCHGLGPLLPVLDRMSRAEGANADRDDRAEVRATFAEQREYEGHRERGGDDEELASARECHIANLWSLARGLERVSGVRETSAGRQTIFEMRS